MSRRGCTIHDLANAKGFTVEQLTRFGVRNGRHVGVEIPYYDRDGNEYIKSQIRIALEGKQTHRWTPGEAPLIPYGLHRPVKYSKAFVWIVEGCSDCWTLWLSNQPALGVPGDKCASCLKLEHIEDCTAVAIIQEPDEAGKRFPHRVAQILYDQGYAGEVSAVVLPYKDARETALHCKTSGELRTVLATAYRKRTLIPRTTMKLPNINVRLLSTIIAEPVRWLWNQRVPESAPSVLAGDGGEGKSFATNGLAAAFTTGGALPGGSIGEPCDVLMWNAEDAPEYVIRARAESCGAALHRIHILDDVNENGARVPFSIRHIPYLSEYLDSHPNIRYVIIDPITALLADVDGHNDVEVRSKLQPLVEVAKRYRAGLTTIMHLKKTETARVLHRLSGTVAFGALGRSVMYLGTHAVSGRKSIDTIKHNMSPVKPQPVEFAITEADGIVWVGMANDLDADSIEASYRVAKRGARPGTVEFVRSMLAQGPCDSEGIFNAATDRGISSTALAQTRKRLGVVTFKRGVGAGSRWFWKLPGQDEDGSPERHLHIVPDPPPWQQDALDFFDAAKAAEDATESAADATNVEEPAPSIS